MAGGWNGTADASDEARARRIVQGLFRLAASEEACRILGIDGTLEDEVDLSFLEDPAEWIAGEIATALQGAEDEDEFEVDGEEDEEPTAATGGASLSTVVALVRLSRALDANISERDVLAQVMEQLEA